MTDAVSELLRALDVAIAILEEAGETHWKTWLERDRHVITGGDARGLEHLLEAFGGMGSLNDLVLGDPAVDDRMLNLRSDIYTNARDVLHEARRDRPQTP